MIQKLSPITMAMCRPETLSKCAKPESRIATISGAAMEVCPPVMSAAAMAPAGPGMADSTRASMVARRPASGGAWPAASTTLSGPSAMPLPARPENQAARWKSQAPGWVGAPGGRSNARMLMTCPGCGRAMSRACSRMRMWRAAGGPPSQCAPRRVTRSPSGSTSASATVPVTMTAARGRSSGGGARAACQAARPKPSAAAVASARTAARAGARCHSSKTATKGSSANPCQASPGSAGSWK